MTQLVREYKGDCEYLNVHHPEEQGVKGEATDSTALALIATSSGGIEDILVL